MSIQICSEHNKLKDFICAKNECNQLICPQCFKFHAEISKHWQAVRLCLDSRQFFLNGLNIFSQIVTHMGYSKVFEMKLQLNHPKGTVSQLNFQEIQKIAIQVLQQHKKITEGNLIFINGTKNISQMIHPEFLKDLYNMACEDTKFNLENLLSNIQRKLIESYPKKQIYKFSKFNILPREILQIQEQRKRLVRQFQQRIIFRMQGYTGSPSKLNTSSSNNTKRLQKEQGTLNQFSDTTQSRFSRDYHSSSQTHLPDLDDDGEQRTAKLNSQSAQGKQQQNMHTNANKGSRSRGQKQQNSQHRKLKQSENENKAQFQQMRNNVSILQQNQIKYEQKVESLQKENKSLRQQLQRLQKVETQQKLSPQQKLQTFFSNVAQKQLKNQISQLQATQSSLVLETQSLNKTLKDLQQLAQARSLTITSLLEQAKVYQYNIQMKQRSIKQLNQLICNQEQQIAYRQNQSEILQQEIKKLMGRIKFLEQSIHQLNNLISNEEEQITYRENQVQTLDREINRLLNRIKQLESSIKSLNSLIANEEEQISYRQNQSDILEKQVKKLLTKIQYLEKSIHELNNLISKEQQQIAQRQNESQTLRKQVRELIQRNQSLESQLVLTSQSLQAATDRLQASKNQLLQTASSLVHQQASQSADQQLLQQVVMLQAELQNKNDDIELLISIAQQYIRHVIGNQSQTTKDGACIMGKLKGLKTVEVRKQAV